MKRRQWDSKSKARIVLEGLRGRSVDTLCDEYRISAGTYYRWRDTLLDGAWRAFESATSDRREKRLLAENQKLKKAVGALTLDLNRTI